MKRKRKNACPSPLLEDIPKRPKVHAQRKFAQGSNVNSPVITPIKELEDLPGIETLPEPVELLPMKRPNTEDFLTFLCFRGTPILPPTLNFFNTASIVDMNGQVHEIKSESSPKNGPIDIAKCGNSSEKPFIAFGVRKRADPIVISKQMDRKRRHALALQALRRKYQEQKMAKIRAIAISKHSEKVTNKTLVKTNTVSKTETVTKKSNTLQKTKIVATKHIKVTTQTLKTTLRPKIKQKMCLRSFRGRYIHKELPFRKKIVVEKKISRPILRKVQVSSKNENSNISLDTPDSSEVKEDQIVKPSVSTTKTVRKAIPNPSTSTNSRMTRSGIINKDISDRLKQKRLLITNTKPHVKSRLLRSTTMKKTVLSRRKSNKQLRAQQKKNILLETKSHMEDDIKTEIKTQEKKAQYKNDPKPETTKSTEINKDFKKVTDIKKESSTIYGRNKRQINKSVDIRKEISKSTDIKKRIGRLEIKRNTRISNVIEKKNLRRETMNLRNVNTRMKTAKTKETSTDNKEGEDDGKRKTEQTKLKKSSHLLEDDGQTRTKRKSNNKGNETEEPSLKSKQNEDPENDFCKTRSSSNKDSSKLSSPNQNEYLKKAIEDNPKRKSSKSISNKDDNLPKEDTNKDETTEREKRKVELGTSKKDLKRAVNKDVLKESKVESVDKKDLKKNINKEDNSASIKERKLESNINTNKKDLKKAINKEEKSDPMQEKKVELGINTIKKDLKKAIIKEDNSDITKESVIESSCNTNKKDLKKVINKEEEKSDVPKEKKVELSINTNKKDLKKATNKEEKNDIKENMIESSIKTNKKDQKKAVNKEETNSALMEREEESSVPTNKKDLKKANNKEEDKNDVPKELKINTNKNDLKKAINKEDETNSVSNPDMTDIEKNSDNKEADNDKNKQKKKHIVSINKKVSQNEDIKEEELEQNNPEKLVQLPKDNMKKKKFKDDKEERNEENDKQRLSRRSNRNVDETDLKNDKLEETNEKIKNMNENKHLCDTVSKKKTESKKDTSHEKDKKEKVISDTEIVQEIENYNNKDRNIEDEDKFKAKGTSFKKDDSKKSSNKDEIVDDKVHKIEKVELLQSKKKNDGNKLEKNPSVSQTNPSKIVDDKLIEKIKDIPKKNLVNTALSDSDKSKINFGNNEDKLKSKNEVIALEDHLQLTKKEGNEKSKNKSDDLKKNDKNTTYKKEDENLRRKSELSKKKEPVLKKKEFIKNKSDNEKTKEMSKSKIDSDSSPKITQRPTRKTKEAAAIYMEILSHKLVDNQIDDDNISIDSFPELPNVKKTEQWENELKAQAKFIKDDGKGKSKDAIECANTENKESTTENPTSKSLGKGEIKHGTSKDSKGQISKEVIEKPQKIGMEKLKNPVEEQQKETKPIQKLPFNKDDKKKKPNTFVSNVEITKKEGETSNEMVSSTKRQTRSAHLNKTESSEDSDQSFHADIKVPKKKKLTRSKAIIKHSKNSDKPLLVQGSSVNLDVVSITDSDESTSDINLQALINKERNKKFSKTKSKKSSHCFSDSDEEPLSKLTTKTADSQAKSKIDNSKESKSVGKGKVSGLEIKPGDMESDRKEKPKRECAKRPQNYLPMFSSSDDEDTFHGFDEKVEIRTTEPLLNPACSHAPPLLDFFAKDISRRFGKEKVNMSNEQIEKWLNESALAGSSIKKENDEMLKFGEKIPTETTLEINESIDTLQLKSSLLQEEPIKTENIEKSIIATIDPVKEQDIDIKNIKPHITDRKLIFRKSKIENIPNINAFSPENESSIYAFGEDNEDMISTPFRRPSRRPSSTATSRSEDELSKIEDTSKTGQFRKPSIKQEIKIKEDCDSTAELEENPFYIPQQPSKATYIKQHLSPNKKIDIKTLSKCKSTEKVYDAEDFKYKVPSSPSASSSSSTKLYKKQTYKPKLKGNESVSPVYMSDFPKKGDPAKLVEAPTFHPTDQEFQDPLEYIERIRHKAEQFGICRIVPPSTFKPECKVTDDMRFTAYNQYVHKMFHRWGPNFKELMAIKKYLETQNISITQPPWIGGMEIDLPRLYQTVQNLGGLKEVIEKKKWPRVSDLMKIPKSAQDRVTKLDDIYCKYLLPYDTLSPAEREKLFDEVETEWVKRESKSFLRAQEKSNVDTTMEGDSDIDDTDVEECFTKGRSMALNAFYRIARNTMSMYFKTAEPSAQEVEQEYWNYVMTRQNHICVHSGSIDSGSWGYGFAVSKNSPFARHSWNLKVLTNNSGSLLRSLGPVMGVTVPTLHVGMVFSACCWYRDPHGLPWIEYLHTGGSKIWYGIPNPMSESFHSTMKNLVPNYCRNKELWLPSDTAMIPPSLLVENNVSLCRTVQDPGQFIIVFPKVFTSSLSTGYVVSESVYFAPTYWLKTARSLFHSLRNCSEPSMFSLDRLLISIANDVRCNSEILRQVIPHIQELCNKEKTARDKLRSFGQMEVEKLALPEFNKNKKKLQHTVEGDYECDICRTSLFVSVVFDTQEGSTYCLDHAIEKLESNEIEVTKCKLIITYSYEDLVALPNKIKTTIESKLQKKNSKQ